MNKVCTDETKNPTVDLVLKLEEATDIDKVVLYFYHEYASMIGLPKDNKVRLSYSNDGVEFTALGEFTFEGAAEYGKLGVIEAIFDIEDVAAQYIGIEFDFGPSPWDTDGKVVWEFIGLTEVDILEVGATPEDPFELVEDSPFVIDGGFIYIGTDMLISGIEEQFKGEVTVSGNGTGATITAGGETLTIVVLGDITGDGVIDSKDYLMAKRAVLNTIELTEAQLRAVLVSGDSEPTAKDYLMIKRHFLGTYDIFANQGVAQ